MQSGAQEVHRGTAELFCTHTSALRNYMLLGPEQRRNGGQAVVQFAVIATSPALDHVAIKFFITKSDYDEEAEVYRNLL